MSKDTEKRPTKQKVLILSHGDGYLEIFGENVDPLIVRVPVAHSIDAEIIAEDCVELSLPWGFRPLYRRDKFVTNGTVAPLYPSTLQRAIGTRESVKRLTAVMEVDQ